ncbi:MAG: acetyl-CoA C-acetyltransferase [Baekduia sp.]|nr:acetyl-CoA C-acetyltransferase [Baekduia sp.]
MTDVVIVGAGRSPVGRRGGVLSGVHPADLLGTVQKAVIERAGIQPEDIGQVIGGCVSQVGEQTMNIARTAWLTAGLPIGVAATTVDTQCGSSQQATALAISLVASGAVDVAMGCGVEAMSRVPMGSSSADWGHPFPPTYAARYQETSQFEGAELIAQAWDISREDTDLFGLRSQQLAAEAWAAGRFADQIVPIEAPVIGPDKQPTDERHVVDRDQGLRETTLENLGNLKPVLEGGVHTAGSASQISDGASAIIVTTAERAAELGLTPLARIVDHCLVGSDPVKMLTGPIPATQRLLERNAMTLDDIDVVEINEAFASVVLAWQRELGVDFEKVKVNPNGGAIALGHPLGGTGAGLVTKAAYELQRNGGRRAIVTMCCGGGVGTGLLLEKA